MARIRTIKPDFWTDEKVVEISAFARLLFIGLWNFADDEGRLVYSEKKIKMQIFPSDNLNMSELFGEIRREKMIDVYEVDNISYIQIVNFSEHQKVDKRSPSKYPQNPNSPAKSPRIVQTEGKGRERKVREEDKEESKQQQESKINPLNPLFETQNEKEKEVNMNDFIAATAACCSLIGVRILSPTDSQILLKYCKIYDIRNYVIPFLAKRLDDYRKKNHGQIPSAPLAYFEKALSENPQAIYLKGKRP